jgi:hypothetical protein
VLGEQERARVQHQDAMVGKGVPVQGVLGEGGPEGAAADDDDVEGAGIGAAGGASQRLIQPVTDVAAEHVLAEVGVLGGRAGHDAASFTGAARRVDVG